MIAVLSVVDVEQARDQLRSRFGFVELSQGRLALGDQQILVCAAGSEPASMLRLPIDHLAFRVPDADAVDAEFVAAGLMRHPAFTPDGPRDIREFWGAGVRFVFFAGPEGWPLEFCAINGHPPAAENRGHGHYGLRVFDLDRAEETLRALGAVLLASHSIEGEVGPVSVRFMRLREQIFELFDEPGLLPTSRMGWVGLIDP